ncbi:MAG TPA: CYTH domain-containing protein, partial [Tahibacter sp.]|nr:CYTH domain-containing protein [Tahibacter sp.]
NIKSSTLGVERQEYEYTVPLADGEAMLATLCDGVVEKIRHYVAAGDHEVEIDEFFGANDGLVVAEIELDAADEAFVRPAWLGREVSHLPRYYNLNLVDRPYTAWTAAEREANDAC